MGALRVNNKRTYGRYRKKNVMSYYNEPNTEPPLYIEVSSETGRWWEFPKWELNEDHPYAHEVAAQASMENPDPEDHYPWEWDYEKGVKYREYSDGYREYLDGSFEYLP